MSIQNLNASTLTRLICFAFAALLIALPAMAQDATGDAAAEADDLLGTIETEEDEDAPPRWLTTVAFGGSLTSGNSDTLGLNLSVGSEKKSEKNEFALGLSGSYGETDSETSTEIANLFFNYKRMFDKSYIFSNTSLFHDKIALIAYRFTTAVGYGRNVIDSERTTLGLEGGVAYIHEDYEDDPTGAMPTLDADDKFSLRLGNNFEYRFSPTAKLWQTAEYMPEFDDFDSYLVNAAIGVEAAMTTTLSLRFSIEDRYNSRPPYDSKRNDLISVIALAINL